MISELMHSKCGRARLLSDRRIHNRHHNIAAKVAARPFALPGSKRQYAPDLPVKVQHIFLEANIHPEKKFLKGCVTHTVQVVAPSVSVLRLDQIGLEIKDVEINKKTVPHEIDDKKITVSLNSPARHGETFEIKIAYEIHHPKRGIYFTGPDEYYPDKPFQVWTQGQDEDSRYWYPGFDYPNQKSTFEAKITVPPDYVVVSNGKSLSKKPVKDGICFHSKIGSPIVTYLASLAIGKFSEIKVDGPGGLPVFYYVQKGREEEAKRSFSGTPKMIEAFEKKTGIKFPFEKYSQVAVQDFIFGGMENASATTQMDETLHDERAALDFTSDDLVAHELAHQWFGDLLTCRDWSQGWLNEGFATFMERVWIECKKGSGGGEDEAKYYSYQDLGHYLDEDGNDYRRPIVCNTYVEPIDIFDRHLYQKGGLVLVLLRSLLTEDLFWKSINHYIEKYKNQNVETLDLIKSIEEVTGRNMRQFFDEWIFGAGHPEFELSYEWNGDRKRVELTIDQKQTDGKPFAEKNGATTHLFHLPVDVTLFNEKKEATTHTIQLNGAKERVFLYCDIEPSFVAFDPSHTIPKTVKFERSQKMLIAQLKNDPDCMGRIDAAHGLVDHVSTKSVGALRDSLLGDSFWGVQAEVAWSLSQMRLDAARDALIEGLKIKHHKARRSVVEALGSFVDSKVANALKPIAEKDQAYGVEAAATQAWISAKAEPFSLADDNSKELIGFIQDQLKKESHLDQIKGSAVKSLAALKGIGRGDQEEGLALILKWAERGNSVYVRVSAVRALGAVMKKAVPGIRRDILSVIDKILDEDEFRLRYALGTVLGDSETDEAIPLLRKLQRLTSDGRIERETEVAIGDLQTSGGAFESYVKLKEEFTKLEKEQRSLKTSFEKLLADKISPKKLKTKKAKSKKKKRRV